MFAGKYTAVDEAKMTRLACDHLQAFRLAHGDDEVMPKHHFALHLASQIARNRAVYDCFVTERKHSSVKTFATNILTTQCFERSLLCATQAEQERQLANVQLNDGLRGRTEIWNGITVSDRAMIDNRWFQVGDVVYLQSACGRVLACADIQGEYGLIVNRGVFVRRVSEHSTCWNFEGESLAIWSAVAPCFAWYEEARNLVVLAP